MFEGVPKYIFGMSDGSYNGGEEIVGLGWVVFAATDFISTIGNKLDWKIIIIRSALLLAPTLRSLSFLRVNAL